ARVIAAVVNGGKIVTPYLIDRVEGSEGLEVVHKGESGQAATLDNSRAMEVVREGLRQAIDSRQPFYGTAWRARNEAVPLIGKTGTAQVAKLRVRAETRAELDRIPYELRDHSWFAAAIDDPSEPMVIVVLCEHAGHASESAVVIVSKIAQEIMKTRQPTGEQVKEEGTSI
ncbi:MAG: hypothetical protein HY801_03480, partial [Candidatus Lindowbacteria bacterium]|nr:hypothetical protein [Candidatus Lindowbacteria bacterium]